ncbi:MAG: Hint domain-containing protein, partial [Alphaproteobacteria bacterium]|nr:Hint domain-containing protein [Alphaproteobacteria bacterium]
MSGSVTVLDNTAGGTATGLLNSGGNVGTSAFRGHVFETAGTSSWELTGIRLALRASSAGATTVTFSLYYVDADNLPTGAVLSTVSVSADLTTTAAYYYFNEAALGDMANYSLSASMRYAVTLSASQSITWSQYSPITPPTAYNGFSYVTYVVSSTGAWFNTQTARPAMQLEAQATCFLRGTLILTSRGEVKVERLCAGDMVATKFGGLRPIRWIGTQRFEGRLAEAGHQPIRFAAGSLGQGIPSCDLRVSPGHAMLVQDGQGGEVLAHAGALVNGSTITQERVRGEIEYFHIDLGPHDCVLANGAWAESYFEDRNRDAFHNAAAFHALNPGHETVRQATCLPI